MNIRKQLRNLFDALCLIAVVLVGAYITAQLVFFIERFV